MRFATAILLFLLISSCSAPQEVRRSNKAARKLERLVQKYPELKRTDTLLIPITTRTPVIHGRIVQPMMYPKYLPGPERTITIIPEVDQAPVLPIVHQFEDETLLAKITLDPASGEAILDYTIKPISVDTVARAPVDTIQATHFEPLPLPWWQSGLQVLGAFALLLLLILLVRQIAK